MTALRIGLTGLIGCGKSTIAGWLAARPGVVAIDADRVARDVLAPGTPELAAVLARFGTDLADAAGTLDRSALGRLVFADPTALRDLESIVHPAVRPRIVAAMGDADQAGARAIVVEAIKLVEGGLADLCDEVWLVTCGPDAQVARLAARGTDAQDATRRIEAQGDLASRIADRADRTLDTSGAATEARDRALAALDDALSRTA